MNKLKPGLIALLVLFTSPALFGFKTEAPSGKGQESERDEFLALEAGRLKEGVSPPAFIALSNREYEKALALVDNDLRREYPWIEPYLEGLVEASAGLIEKETPHFRFFLPPDQMFLFDYASEALERSAETMDELFQHRPESKIIVEIYPTKERFSAASTLSEEILKRSGAIGICKFHRLMILSPQALPTGYRWMDALAHEYNHLLINELSAGKAELWLHEGTARFFDTAYRADPPVYLSANQKTRLLDAREEETLVPFKKMSPSLVYLKDQDEVSLAFAQVSNAVDLLVDKKSVKSFKKFLVRLQDKSFPEAFHDIYQMTPDEFEAWWRESLARVDWKKSKGAMEDRIQFESEPEENFIGASAKGQTRLGDRMRMKGLDEAALIQYERALEQEPDNGVILLKAARAAKKVGKMAQAEEFLRRAVEKNPDYVSPYLDLAGLTTGGESLKFIEHANAINPFDPRVHALWALRLEEEGKKESAAREKSIAADLVKQLKGR